MLFDTGGMGASGSDQAILRNVARRFSERGPIFEEVALASWLVRCNINTCVWQASLNTVWGESLGRRKRGGELLAGQGPKTGTAPDSVIADK